jgi:hypothetical protein
VRENQVFYEEMGFPCCKIITDSMGEGVRVGVAFIEVMEWEVRI